MRVFLNRKGQNCQLGRFVLVAMLSTVVVTAPASDITGNERMQSGKKLAMERSKGNCLACHMMDDGPLAGNIGPPLIAMKARFPDREVLFGQIWDSTVRNPDSRMPPFGEYGILTQDEIERIVDYLYTL